MERSFLPNQDLEGVQKKDPHLTKCPRGFAVLHVSLPFEMNNSSLLNLPILKEKTPGRNSMAMWNPVS